MVVIVKLSTGTEVVGEIVSEDKQTIALQNPITIVYRQMMSGNPSISFAPYSPFTDESIITFGHQHIVNMMKPSPVFEQYYAVLVDKTEKTRQVLIDELSDFLGINPEARELSWEDDREEIYKHLLEQMTPTANTTYN